MGVVCFLSREDLERMELVLERGCWGMGRVLGCLVRMGLVLLGRDWGRFFHCCWMVWLTSVERELRPR